MTPAQLAVLVGNGPSPGALAPTIDGAAFVARINGCRGAGAEYGSRTDRVYLCNTGGVGRRFASDSALHRRIAALGCPEVVLSYPRARALRLLAWAFLGKRGAAWTHDQAIAAALARVGIVARSMPASLYRRVRRLVRQQPGFWRFRLRRRVWNPSSGCMALAHMLDDPALAGHRILLVGFGFQGSDMHPWFAERALVEQAIAQGRVLPLSTHA